MDSSRRCTLAKALKQIKPAKGGGDSLAFNVPPTTSPAPVTSLPSPPSSPQTHQTPTSPSPIDAVPLAAASTCAPAPLDKGKRVLEITSNSEDSDGGLVFKKRRATRVPTLPTASPSGVDSLRDNPPSATSPPPQTVQEERDEGAESVPPPLPLPVGVAASGSAPPTPAPVASPSEILIPRPIFRKLARGFTKGFRQGTQTGEKACSSTWGPSWR
ncbi:lysine-rich arabinogalactan protein 19-like [Phaseolus vulgaris]|uniref:lysine-rich arabinogalactan protein 19-like n=1 Tax=Phaseolus vulgaris TaxID=3885 RepID=UPI0035CB45BC